MMFYVKRFLIITFCTVALAGAKCNFVFAQESFFDVDVSDNNIVPDVGSESEKVGDFGDDSANPFQDFLDFLTSLHDTGLDLSTDSEELESLDDSVDSSDDFGIDLYSDYTTYPSGTIAEPFVTYFRGYLPKLHWNQHYLLFRSNEGVSVGSNYVYGYVYYFVVGDSLSVSGSTFTGSNVTVYRMYYYNTSHNDFGVTTQSTFSLTQTGGSFIFTDLDGDFPSLETVTDRTSRQILYSIVIFCLISFISSLYAIIYRRK